jgi:putative PIN family toxin of toxin-antitoxin system
MLRIVIDTCVLVSAIKSNQGASYKLLSLLPKNIFTFHISTALVLEYEDVLKRPKLELSLTLFEVDKLLDILCLLGKKHLIHFQWRPLLNDQHDDFVGELAINAKVDMIVTHNVKDFGAISNFGIVIVTPHEFLKLIGELK